jgi:hypothetical protein
MAPRCVAEAGFVAVGGARRSCPLFVPHVSIVSIVGVGGVSSCPESAKADAYASYPPGNGGAGGPGIGQEFASLDGPVSAWDRKETGKLEFESFGIIPKVILHSFHMDSVSHEVDLDVVAIDIVCREDRQRRRRHCRLRWQKLARPNPAVGRLAGALGVAG